MAPLRFICCHIFIYLGFLAGCQAAHTESTTAATEVSPNHPQELSFNVMAPLLVADGKITGADAKWQEFADQLAAIKKLGGQAVSTDVWWGLVEPKDQNFDWTYYDKLSDTIAAADLAWMPILSFHQCGGNVGDDCNIPIPTWLWTDSAHKYNVQPNDLMYVSEQGNASKEVISAWGSKLLQTQYQEFMTAFAEHFAGKSKSIREINISLGPAGELRYPSYNAHDTDTGYPTRGALQSYSTLAVADFRTAMLKKYGSFAKIKQAWGSEFAGEDPQSIKPPAAPETFLRTQQHTSKQYGRDFFDWYQNALLAHGERVLGQLLPFFRGKRRLFAASILALKSPASIGVLVILTTGG